MISYLKIWKSLFWPKKKNWPAGAFPRLHPFGGEGGNRTWHPGSKPETRPLGQIRTDQGMRPQTLRTPPHVWSRTPISNPNLDPKSSILGPNLDPKSSILDPNLDPKSSILDPNLDPKPSISDQISCQMENRVFTKNLNSTWFLPIKTHFSKKTS